MNTRADIRQAIFDDMEWDPAGSEEAVNRANRAINEAVRKVATTMPAGFLERVERLYTCPDVVSASDDDLVAPLLATDFEGDYTGSTYIANPWVFRTVYQSQGLDGDTVDWDTTRLWDGRFVELEDVNTGAKFIRQIRTVWQVDIGPLELPVAGKTTPAVTSWSEYRFSIVEPWDGADGVGPFKWKVYQPTYTLPSELVTLKGVKIKNVGEPPEDVQVVTPEQMETLQENLLHPTIFTNTAGFVVGRAPPVTLKALATAPETRVSSARWLGPEPPGTFEYRVTLAWGKVDRETLSPGLSSYATSANEVDVSSLSQTTAQRGRSRHRMPRWESAPSPVSEQATVAISEVEGTPQAPVGVDVVIPNVEYMLGFLMALDGPSVGQTTYRENLARSGIYAIIYRRRVSEDYTNYTELGTSFSGLSAPTLRKLDLLEGFYKLAELRIDVDNRGVFTDDGTILPDMSVPLRAGGRHSELEAYPRPTARNRLEVRYVENPTPMEDDTDVLPVTPAGLDLVIALAGQKMASAAGRIDALQMFRMREIEAKAALAGTNNLVPASRVMRVRPARARRGRIL